MKIRVIYNFLFISYLFSLPFDCFSQTKPNLKIFDDSKVCDGYILYMDKGKCQLMDRNGNTLFNIPGSLIAIFNNKEAMTVHVDNHLIVYNKDLNELWRTNTYVRNELTVAPNDNILLLSEEYDSINHNNIRFDKILCFDSSGKELFKWSTFDQRGYLMSYMMKDKSIFHHKIKGSLDPDSVFVKMAPALAMDNSRTREFFHMNSIQVIPENESGKKDTIFKKGNILLSFCNYSKVYSSFIAIVDPVNFKILWHYVQKDKRPMHTPTMLSTGHILLYANSWYLKPSIIEEIDPLTNKVVWKYTEKFSKARTFGIYGSCQRLPNGNTLISNRDGYIYEVTNDKKIVWKWCINEKQKAVYQLAIYRAYLFPQEKINWLINEK